ncbi:hypothetical protein cypCar_00040777, partial [Cyprinus carpio]
LRCVAAMATLTPCFLWIFALLQLAVCSFPEEPGPLISAPAEVVRRYPVFVGRAHRSYTRQEPLYIQTVLKVNRTLYIGARDLNHMCSSSERNLLFTPLTGVWIDSLANLHL